MYEKLSAIIVSHRSRILSPAPDKQEKKEQTKMVKIKLLRAFPSFVGPDSVEYGPYREDDIVDVPAESAKMLIDNGIAENP